MKHLLILLLLPLLLATACQKSENDDPAEPYCLVTKMYSQGDTSQHSSKFLYDPSGKLTYWDWPGFTDDSITYESNKIVVWYTLTNNYTVYNIGRDSMAISSSRYFDGEPIDTTYFYYDDQKFLAKTVCFSTVFGKDSTILTYSGQNLSAIRVYHHNGKVSYANFEYGDEVSKSWMYQTIVPYIDNGMYYPWLSKSNKNLIKSYTSNFNGTPEPLNFIYVLNDRGYVEYFRAIFRTYDQKTFFQYYCQ